MYLPQVINYYFNHISLESLFNLNAKHVYKELQGKNSYFQDNTSRQKCLLLHLMFLLNRVGYIRKLNYLEGKLTLASMRQT